jgi:hypothetical protein
MSLPAIRAQRLDAGKAGREGRQNAAVYCLSIAFWGFLNFATTVAKSDLLPKNLTERRFRSLWEQTAAVCGFSVF